MHTDILEGYFVYALMNKDHCIYVGYTSRLLHRLESHNSNCGAMATKNKGHWYLFYFEHYTSDVDAKLRESEIIKTFKTGTFLERTYWSRASILNSLGIEHADWAAKIVNNSSKKAKF